MQNRAFGALAAALLLCCAHVSTARSEPLRVLYAEPFQAQATSAPGTQKSGPANLRVQAFGRTFELHLADNSRLLRGASAQARASIGAVQLLKGTIQDAPGSWVRLTLKQGRYSGAFWDGSELYAIAPRETLDQALLVPMAASGTAIYRLSDTQGGLLSGTCAAAGSTPQDASPTAKFRSLIRELRSAANTAFAAAPREIQISMVGDFEFTKRFGNAAVSAMLDRMNVVDGIFSSQVGVTIIPTDFITFPANDDPFTSSAASTLLDQIADYRNTTSVVRSRGLAHLLTGRQLDGDTVGIAFIGSLCSAREGAGLSEISSFVDSPLVIAHEIGHNFGAPHDAEAGSPCASTPASFLMAPELNGSSAFSSCSLQQIQPRVNAAACIVAAHNRDLAVSVPTADMQTTPRAPFRYVVDVASVGDTPALNGILTVQFPSFVLAGSVSMPGAECTLLPGSVRCELPALGAGETLRLTFEASFNFAGDFAFINTVTSSNDVNSANDIRQATVHVLRETVVGVTIAPQPLTVTSGQTFEMTYQVSSDGALPLNNMSVEIGSGAMTPTSVSVNSGTCTLPNPSNSSIMCQLGTIAPGAPRQVRVQWAGLDRAGDFGGFLRTINPGQPQSDRFESFQVHVRAARDIAVDFTSGFQTVAIGADASWTLQVGSIGVNTVDDVHVQLSTGGVPGVTLTVDGPLAANCTVTAEITDCALGAMGPQTVQLLPFRTRAVSETNGSIIAHVVLPTPDNNQGNDGASASFSARVADEIQVLAGQDLQIYEARLASINALVAARGANASENVRANVTLPTGFVIQSASLDNRLCTVDTASPHLASCTLTRLEVNGSSPLQVVFVASQPGTFTGTLEVSANADTDSSNNTDALSFEVLPNVDARLVGPSSFLLGRTDQPLDMVFTIATNKYDVPDATLMFTWYSLDELTASAPGATCTSQTNSFRCDWLSLPANSEVPITVHVRSSVLTTGTIQAILNATADVDGSNNFASLAFTFVQPGDIAVSVSQATVAATAGQVTTVPGIDLIVLSQVTEPFIDLTFDPASLDAVNVLDGSCGFQQQVLRCQVFGLQMPGTYHLELQVQPHGAGTVPIGIRVGAFNDFNPANDQQMLTLTVANAPPPPPPPPPPPSNSGGGGGGGGGSMSWLLAALLILMWHHRRARSRVYR